MAKTIRLTVNLDPETESLLERIAQAEWRSKSSTLVLLVRKEAATRGLLARAPETMVQPTATKLKIAD